MRRKDALREANITHIITVMRPPLDYDLYEGYQHLVIPINDDDTEDVIQHFKDSNDFIQKGLDAGGGVLVHW